MYLRRVHVKGHTYYMLVRGERRGKAVRQVVVAYFGKEVPDWARRGRDANSDEEDETTSP